MKRRTVLTGLAAGCAGGLGALDAMAKTTARDSFFVPPEEAPHEMTFMQWPVSRQVYRDPWFLKQVQDTIAEIANTIAAFEPVTVLMDQRHIPSAAKRLSSAIDIWDIPTEDLWCRDSGPIFVVDGQGNRAVRHIQFNGWGNKQVHTHDGKIAERVAQSMGVPLLPTDLRGEAGGVEQDGHGLLMAHESSWVVGNRNPGMSRNMVEAALLAAYGADRMIWAPGLEGEDITDYHIDSLARFTGPGRVLMNLPDSPDPTDPFHQTALETHDILKASGVSLEVIPEPVQRRVKSYDFVASYVNYYVCNGGVIAAQFGDPETDAIAHDALARHYPGREIVMLNVDALGEIGGGIHCATHQVPAV